MADGAGTDIFSLAEQRLAWLDRRSSVLAENIANADTPGYRPRDLLPFAQALAQAVVVPQRTSPLDLPALAPAVGESRTDDSGTAPDGNGVHVDVELTKLADTETAQNLVTSVWKSYVGMYRTVLDK